MQLHIDLNIADELIERYELWKDKIRQRLKEFRSIPPSKYFYELCYCLLTPQSKAVHCDYVVSLLEENDFLNNSFNSEPMLHPSKSMYVRFHRTKARRLDELKIIYPSLFPQLTSGMDSKLLREIIVKVVKGIGYKEASHFLRNIGRTDVTILDRHILKNFVRMKLIEVYPKSISRNKYFELEKLFEELAGHLNIPAAELDLLLWSNETGMILK